MVLATVSESLPKMLFEVDQHASPFNIFFTDDGFFRPGGSIGAVGRKTELMACSVLRRTRCFCGFVFASDMKSST
jgi:hypothetical protein